ncbi:hypothetical protein [Prevotella pallens]|uniref:hypothetical protein n=1 Tax=Prevotella pallens TaxID=60133 RepID=UPI00352DC875
MLPAIAAALIAGGASVGSNIIGGIFNRNAQRAANNTNMAIARETNAQNYQIFREQNEFNKEQLNNYLQYNTPAAQRARFEDAGINPYMALGSMQNGNAQSALTSANSAPMQATQVQPENGMAQGIQGALLNAATVMSAVSDARLKNAEADKRNLENGVFAQDFANRMEEIRSRIGLNDSSRDKNKSEKNIYDFDFKFKNDTLANAMKLSDISVQQGDALLNRTLAETTKIQVETDVMNWDLGLKKKYDEQLIKTNLANAIADYFVKLQGIKESNNRMRNDNIRTNNDTRRVGIEQQNANSNSMNAQTNAYNARTNRFNAVVGYYSMQQQGQLIVSQVAKNYAEATGVMIDNQTRGILNRMVIGKLIAETENIEAGTKNTERDTFWMPFNNIMRPLSGMGNSFLNGYGFGLGFFKR